MGRRNPPDLATEANAGPDENAIAAAKDDRDARAQLKFDLRTRAEVLNWDPDELRAFLAEVIDAL